MSKASSSSCAHGDGPRLRAEGAEFQRRMARVEPLGAELVDQAQGVGWRRRQDVGLEIADQLDLPLCHAAGYRDDCAAELLRAVVIAEAAGEEAVAVGYMRHHTPAPAGGAHRPRHDLAPCVEIVARIADHRWLPGRARGSVNAGELTSRHGQKTERIVGPQVRLGGEGKAGEVRKAVEIGGRTPAASNLALIAGTFS